jgi:ketosteroid isomerase-like protein
MSGGLVAEFERNHRVAQEAFNRGDFEAALSGLAPDVEWDMLGTLPEAELLKGRDRVITMFRDVLDAIEWRTEAQDFADLGQGRVLVHQRGTATGNSTGVSGASDFFQVWEIGRDGLVHRVREFTTRDEAEAAYR